MSNHAQSKGEKLGGNKSISDSKLERDTVSDRSISFTQIVILLGFSLGIIISWGVFSGDSLGRVNLIHLVFLYLFFPIFSIAVSTISLLLGKSLNFTKMVGYLPILSERIKRNFLIQNQTRDEKLSFYYQSQLAALSFRFASLMVFILLLLSRTSTT